ncbi:MAG TPA: hypothetical protein DCQ92_03780 [Verrucomicrobia subdivision 3 bacterium]|nr:hypothetical protein [Limisphaerales bacterium]
MIVILGVLGEFVAEFTKFLNGKTAKKKFEKLSVLVLIFGLAIELLAHSTTSHISGIITAQLNEEAGKARKAAGDATERAEELRKKNIELETKLQPRRITTKQKEAFANYLKDFPKSPVKVFVGIKDSETKTYASQIRALLDEAGYGTGKNDDVVDIGANFIYDSPIGDLAKDLPVFFCFFGPQGESIEWPGLKITWQTNGDTVWTYLPNDARAVPAIMNSAFLQIGINAGCGARTNWPFISKPGDWMIFIPQKF